MKRRVTISQGGRIRFSGFAVAIAALSLGAGPPASGAEPGGFWERALDDGGAGDARFEPLMQKADEILAPDKGISSGAARTRGEADAALHRQRAAKAAPALRAALALRPGDLRAILNLADVENTLGNAAEAVRVLRQGLANVDLPAQQAQCWARLAMVHVARGQYTEAIAATDRQLALASVDGSVYANLGEFLMAVGRLPEAEDRYREAIRADTEAPDRRLRERSLSLSYYGLGVALDRDGQAAAAREMMGRALALDPGLSMLQLAQQPGSDVSFLPAGDVHYYLALAREVAGRAAEAEDAFRAFLAAQPGGRWEKAARAHLATLEAQRKRRGARGGFRVVATATVHASGPIPAPMIDAAWRRRPDLVDACVARLALPPGREPFRVPLDVEIDALGATARATVAKPTDLDAAFVACVEQAVRAGLVVPGAPGPASSSRGKTAAASTLARIELLVAD